MFGLVNVALVLLKRAEAPPPAGIYLAPRWVPCAGAVSRALFLVTDLAIALGR